MTALVAAPTRAGAFVAAVVAVVALTLGDVGPIGAQETEWIEHATSRFVVLTAAGDSVDSADVAERADDIHDGLAAAFGVELPSSVALRVHPSIESYLRANPLVVDVDGALAGPRKRRREIEVVLPLVETAGPDGLDNAIRREIARLLAASLSNQEVPEVLLQGVALYMQTPDEPMAAGVARLRDAFSRGSLEGPSGLVAPGAVYEQPLVAQAESRAFIQFVVDTRGFGALTRWLSGMADASGWRQAMESGLDAPPEDVTASFEAWLPSYLDGGWREHALYSGHLAPLEQLLGRGGYDAAVAHLEAIRAVTQGVRPDIAERADVMLTQAEAGRTAGEQIAAALAALRDGDYSTADTNGGAARDAYRGLGDTAGAATAEEVVRRAQLGLRGQRDLARSHQMSPWRIVGARLAAARAAEAFTTIGNDAVRDQALNNAARIDRRLVPTAWAFLIAGAVLLIWNATNRARERGERDGSSRP